MLGIFEQTSKPAIEISMKNFMALLDLISMEDIDICKPLFTSESTVLEMPTEVHL